MIRHLPAGALAGQTAISRRPRRKSMRDLAAARTVAGAMQR